MLLTLLTSIKCAARTFDHAIFGHATGASLSIKEEFGKTLLHGIASAVFWATKGQ